MIAYVQGKVLDVSDKSVIVETQGVGYEIATTTDTLAKARVETPLALFTHLAVKDDALELYGFESRKELSFFQILITVSGVGPRSAIAIVSLGSIDAVKKAIGSGDVSYLTRVSGIGKKTAERIVVELRDKLASLGHSAVAGELSGEADTLEALIGLGYSREEARDALKKVPETVTGTNEKIKAVLKMMGK
jgi:Holliday junction DNA helicase RuvA